jgi:hypothetical protein
MPDVSPPVSFRVRFRVLGGHVHARVFASEFGAETAHGGNGTLTFRLTEWPAFRRILEHGAKHAIPDRYILPSDPLHHIVARVEFIDETENGEAR